MTAKSHLTSAEARALLQAARAAARAAYAPYSRFTVGAALLTASGRIVKGCNVENSSYGLTICAERTAAARAIAMGERSWRAIAVVSPAGVTPCGACRQFLAEFAPDLEIWISTLEPGSPGRALRLRRLLPLAMRLESSPPAPSPARRTARSAPR